MLLKLGHVSAETQIGKGFRNSQHVAVPVSAYGGRDIESKKLGKADLLTSGIGLSLSTVPRHLNAMHLGTQEIKLWGMCSKNMEPIVGFFCLVPVQKEKHCKIEINSD